MKPVVLNFRDFKTYYQKLAGGAVHQEQTGDYYIGELWGRPFRADFDLGARLDAEYLSKLADLFASVERFDLMVERLEIFEGVAEAVAGNTSARICPECETIYMRSNPPRFEHMNGHTIEQCNLALCEMVLDS